MKDYTATQEYWNSVFGERKEFDPFSKFPFEIIEEGLAWVAQDVETVFDFGCGTGRILYRCLDLGAKEIYGMDLSEEAIRLANQVVEKYGLQGRSTFVSGSVADLEQFEDQQFDGVILSNILDNLLPADGQRLIEEIHRIVKPQGKILLKLNDYEKPEDLAESNDLELIADHCYKESSGLYFWNLSRKAFEELIAPYFTIEKYVEVEFTEYDQVNRMFYLRK